MTEFAPQLSESAAYEAASRLRRTSTLAECALEDLAAGTAPSWWGGASDAYYASRGRVSGRLTALDVAANRLAAAVAAYATDAGMASARWRQAQAERDFARTNPSPAALTDPSLAGVEVADAEAAIARAQADYRDAVSTLARAARWTLDAVDDVRGVDDHLREGVRRFVQIGVIEPAATAVSLGLGWVTDRAAWKAQVAAIPEGLWQQATQPRQTLGTLLGEQDFRNGDWGAGAGTALAGAGAGAGSLVSLRHVLRNQREETTPGADGSVRARSSPDAPTLLPQTTDELFAGVDLRRQEVHRGAHTISHHVDVARQDLVNRYDRRPTTPQDGGVASARTISRFYDLAVAEHAVTLAVRENEAVIRDMTTNSSPRRLQVNLVLPGPAGEVIRRDAAGNMQVVEGTTVVVVLGRSGTGQAYVYTAYLEGR